MLAASSQVPALRTRLSESSKSPYLGPLGSLPELQPLLDSSMAPEKSLMVPSSLEASSPGESAYDRGIEVIGLANSAKNFTWKASEMTTLNSESVHDNPSSDDANALAANEALSRYSFRFIHN